MESKRFPKNTLIFFTTMIFTAYYNMWSVKKMPEIKKYPAWEELTFANNFLFCKIMEENPEICRRLLEILLHIKIEKLSPQNPNGRCRKPSAQKE